MCTTVHRRGDVHTKQQSGFTLVELAVVIFLVGLMASLGLSALNAQIASASISATKKKQETIKDALISYLGKYKRLPCPAIVKSDGTIDGSESRDSSVTAGNWDCKAEFGIVPYATLGLPKNAALDGWENFFSYAVSRQWTLTYSTATPIAGGTTTNIAGNAFNVGITGAILVNDRAASIGNPIIPISTTTGGPAAVFIISHGKNGLGTFTSKGTQNAPPAGTDELANVPNKTTWALPTSSTFYQREYTDNATAYGAYGAFDDVAQFLNPNDLITPLTKDGALKSAEAQWADQAVNIGNTLGGYMLTNNNCAPPPNNQFSSAILTPNGIPAIDPWGRNLDYVQCITELKTDSSVTTSGGLTTLFINKLTGLTQSYSSLCTNPSQLPFAITVVTDFATNPVTRLPVLTNLTVSKFFGANSNFIMNNCPT